MLRSSARGSLPTRTKRWVVKILTTVSMAKRLHYGKHSLPAAHSLELNKCAACGTTNPSVPGKPRPEKCSGCGKPIVMPHTAVVTTASFTPPKRKKDEEE